MKQKLHLLLMSVTALLAGCSDDNVVETMTVTQANNTEIAFRGVIDKTEMRAGPGGDTGDAVALAKLTSFFVHGEKGTYDFGGDPQYSYPHNLGFMNAAAYYEAYTGSEDEKTGSGSWTYSPIRYWTVNGAYNFFAYAPIKDVNMVRDLQMDSNGKASFVYLVPELQDAKSQVQDLLVAGISDYVAYYSSGSDLFSRNGEIVAFTFYHALSAVSFQAEVAQNSSVQDLTFVVNSISLPDLYTKGKYTFDKPISAEDHPGSWSWEGYTRGATYKAPLPGSGSAVTYESSNTNLLAENNLLMMMPQEVASDATVEIGFSVKTSDGLVLFDNKVVSLAYPDKFEFKQGTHYKLSFTFGTGGIADISALKFDVYSVSDWYSNGGNPE